MRDEDAKRAQKAVQQLADMVAVVVAATEG